MKTQQVEFYSWTAYRRSKRVTGTVAADSEADALRQVQVMGLSGITIAPQTPLQRLLRANINPRSRDANLADIAWFARQMSTLIRIGREVVPSLRLLARQRAGTRFGSLLARTATAIEGGASLADAFNTYEHDWGSLVVTLISAAEVGGKLPDMLDRLASITERRALTAKRVQAALAYPITVAVVATLVAAAIIFIVVPDLQKIFISLGGHLPLPTQIVVDASGALRSVWWLYPLLALVVIWAAGESRRHDAWRLWRDRMVLRIPMIGKILEQQVMARATAVMGLLLDSGVSLIESLTRAGESAGNLVWANAFTEVSRLVTDGISPTAAFSAQTDLPDALNDMIAVGEESGHLDETLAVFSERLDAETAIAIDRLNALIEPALTAAFGVVIGALIITLYLPIFDMYKTIQHLHG